MPVQSVVSEKKARRAYIPYTALTLDADYRICTYGDAAYCLFGHPEAAMLGKPVSAIIQGLKKISDGFNEVRMEAKRADGHSIPVMVALRRDCLHGTCRHLVLVRNLQNRNA